MRTQPRRALPRRERRIPNRAARRALAPTHPKGAELLLAQELRRAAGAVADAILEAVEPLIPDFAAPPPDEDGEGKATKLDAPPRRNTREAVAMLRKRAMAALETTKPRVEKTSDKAGGRIDDHVAAECKRLGIKLLEAEPSFRPRIKAWRAENVDRIVSLTASKVDRVEDILREGAGMRVETIRKRIMESVGATKRQAALIARDQVLKLNSQITTARHESAGITEYYWTCSGDERVRGRPDGLYPDAKPSHWELDGKRFKYASPPVSGPHGRRGHPGTMFQCRCTAYPIIPELEAEGLA